MADGTIRDEPGPLPLDGGDVLDDAAQAQLARRRPLGRLLVGQVAGGEPQELPVLGKRLRDVGALAG